jgi:alkylation response protein AidB-like acyl-CoA dehydrogenase
MIHRRILRKELLMTDAYFKALEEVITDVVVPTAPVVDRDGVFPRKAMEALGATGILGLTCPVEVGGGGGGLGDAALVVQRLSEACGSTGMVVLMHFAAVSVITRYGPPDVVEAIAKGRHLTTLALSEVGSRSHFWAPMSTASNRGDTIVLSARKSWVTSAGEADSYVWSSRAMEADGPMTLWLLPATTPGVRTIGGFDGLGLRGNASCPMCADDAVVPHTARLGPDGAGLDVAMELVLPAFLVLNAAFSVGLMQTTVREAISHLTGTRLEHLGQTLADQPLVRFDIGRLRIEADRARAVLTDTITALEEQREDAMLRLLEVKAVAAEAAITVTDLAMKACGGAAFRRELGLERRFRDARAARVMAPTTDRLTDFVGRLACGMPLLDGT